MKVKKGDNNVQRKTVKAKTKRGGEINMVLAASQRQKLTNSQDPIKKEESIAKLAEAASIQKADAARKQAIIDNPCLYKKFSCSPIVRDNTLHIDHKCEINKRECHVETAENELFYNSLNWIQLSETIMKYMETFNSTLLNDTDVLLGLEKLYSYKTGDTIKVRRLTTPGQTRCNDITFVFSIHQPIELRDKSSRLFHISLHSKLSKWRELSMGSKAHPRFTACSYYPKDRVVETNGRNSYESGTGAFHYKIDKLVFSENIEEFQEHESPYKIFTITNTNQFENDDKPFQKLTTADMERTGKYSKDDITSERLHEISILHNIIYNMFITFWNTHILAEIRTVQSSSSYNNENRNILLKSGGRMTRRHKKYSRRTHRYIK
jgi:hypothetical protein